MKKSKELKKSEYNKCLIRATYNVMDFVDKHGEFKFMSMEHMRRVMGDKACAVKGVSEHVRPGTRGHKMVIVHFYDRQKAMDKLLRHNNG